MEVTFSHIFTGDHGDGKHDEYNNFDQILK